MKQWRWLIIALIGLFGAIVGPMVTTKCSNDSDKNPQENHVEVAVDKSENSSKHEENTYQNEGDVSSDEVTGDKVGGDKVAGDKNVYYYQKDVSPKATDNPVAPPKNRKAINDEPKKVGGYPITYIDKIENNSGIINAAPISGGEVTQIVVNPKPQPRHLSNELLEALKNAIPKDYKVTMGYPANNKESEDYALEVLNALIQAGYDAQIFTRYSHLILEANAKPVQGILFNKDPNGKSASITVLKQEY